LGGGGLIVVGFEIIRCEIKYIGQGDITPGIRRDTVNESPDKFDNLIDFQTADAYGGALLLF